MYINITLEIHLQPPEAPVDVLSKTSTKAPQIGGGKYPVAVRENHQLLETYDQISTDPSTSEFMPPENDLAEILENMEENNKFKFAKFPYGVFSHDALKTFRSFHTKKDRDHRTEQEKKWFRNVNKFIPSCQQTEKSINLDKVSQFFIRSDLSEDDTTLLPGIYKPSYKDLMSLTCDRWLLDSIILKSIELLMSGENDCYIGYLSNVMDFACSGFLVRQKHGCSLKKFIFAMNVCKVGAESEIAGIDRQSGNHFSFCVLTLDDKKASVLYIDTLRYALPKSLRDCLPTFLLGYLENYDVKEWNFQTVSNTYPRQTCSSICGPAVIIGMSLAIKQPEIFEAMTSTVAGRGSGCLARLSHVLPNLSTSSVYIRCTILNWLMEGKIIISNLLLKNKVTRPGIDGSPPLVNVNPVNVNMPPISVKINEPQHRSPKNTVINIKTSNAGEEQSKSVTKETANTGTKNRSPTVPLEVSGFLHKIPEVQLSKKHSLQLRCTLKSGHKLITKNFKCSDLGLQDDVSWGKINEFLNSVDCISWLQSKSESFNSFDFDTCACTSLEDLLEKKTKIRFCKPHYLHVTCYLKGGFSISKKVKCNEQHKNDPDAMDKINDFLKSPDTLELAQNKIIGQSPKKVCDNEWISDGSIAVGLPIKNLIDAFPIDVLKKIEVHLDSVESVYLGNQSTLNVSVTSNKTWGKTHRYDETYRFVKEPPSKNVTAVTMMITCASKTDVCRSKCGVLLNEPNCNMKDGKCEACFETIVVTNHTWQCDVCSETNSPNWRFVNNQSMCNTCYVYFKKHGINRHSKLRLKASLKNKKRKTYIKHFQCSWKMKFVVYSSDLSTWKIFQHQENSKYHQEPAQQIYKRPNLSTRDLWDFQRVTQKATARQIHVNDNRKFSVHFSESNEQEEKKQYYPKTQVVNRVKTVDKINMQNAIKVADDIPHPGSDWRNT
jgi:hypothetical protein